MKAPPRPPPTADPERSPTHIKLRIGPKGQGGKGAKGERCHERYDVQRNLSGLAKQHYLGVSMSSGLSGSTPTEIFETPAAAAAAAARQPPRRPQWRLPPRQHTQRSRHTTLMFSDRVQCLRLLSKHHFGTRDEHPGFAKTSSESERQDQNGKKTEIKAHEVSYIQEILNAT